MMMPMHKDISHPNGLILYSIGAENLKPVTKLYNNCKFGVKWKLHPEKYLSGISRAHRPESASRAVGHSLSIREEAIKREKGGKKE